MFCLALERKAMNLHVLHKIGSLQTGNPASVSVRKKRRRSCAICRTFIRHGAIRCHYCRQWSPARWHLLLLGVTILLLSFLILNVLNSVGA